LHEQVLTEFLIAFTIVLENLFHKTIKAGRNFLMDIMQLLSPDTMLMNLQGTTQDEVLNEMIACLKQQGIIDDPSVYKADILAREAETTTGIGGGIAIPHAKDQAVKRARVLFARSVKGVDYHALDSEPVHLFFMIAAPAGANQTHLQALASLSALLIDPNLVAKLLKTDTPNGVMALFKAAQAAKVDQTQAQSSASDMATHPFIVAVTACPTGIAHTYMAEAALHEAAQKLNVDIKVETDGAEGVKHRLTPSDIAKATGVIITADKKIERDRFDGKRVIDRSVTEGIKSAPELIQATLDEKGPIFHAANPASTTADASGDSLWNRIYKDLMNGVSNMLPFVVGGGIVMAFSFILEQWLGKNSLGFTFTNSLGNYAFSFLVPVLAAYIAEAIGDRPALMPGFVGGWMATQVAASITKAHNPSGFLGGLVAGFVAGWLIVLLKHVFKRVPKQLDGIKTILLYPVISLALIGCAMYFAINPVFAAINGALMNFLTKMGTGNAVLLGAIMAGMQAADLGGPINKAAYTTAIGVLATTGDGSMMASVMVGGMVPPLAIAIATTFWKAKFTSDEQKAGISNYVLGLSFITEGAIPFAIADPVRVISACVIGSVTAGGLVQFLHVSVPAPHGGIWVTLLMHNPLGFVLALVIGSVLAGVIYGLLKPQLSKQPS
jgi:PTS system fructose-specific IIC component